MFRYVLKRLGAVVVTFIVMTIIVFSSIRLLPGSTLDLMMESADLTSAGSEEAARMQLQSALGLDQPVHVQYFRWMKEFLSMAASVTRCGGRRRYGTSSPRACRSRWSWAVLR